MLPKSVLLEYFLYSTRNKDKLKCRYYRKKQIFIVSIDNFQISKILRTLISKKYVIMRLIDLIEDLFRWEIYPKISDIYQFPDLTVNCLGFSDGFFEVGLRSQARSIWNSMVPRKEKKKQRKKERRAGKFWTFTLSSSPISYFWLLNTWAYKLH